ncbi:hypothetical protein Tco_1540292 [Tanacetum coccineum]
MLPMIISIRIPYMLHLDGKLFESLGCLVLVRRDCISFSRFTIYEMRKAGSVWLSKYTVNTDDFMNPLPKGWSIRSIVWRIILGKKEEDSFLIINLSAKVVQYNLISKTLRDIYDMGSNEIADDYLHGFIPPYAISSFDCDFVSLDPRINLRKYIIENSFTLGSTKEANKVKILQSCNGLLLCTGLRRHAFDYVYNSSTKVNNALHWLETENNQLTHYKLNIEYSDHPIIAIIQIPQILKQGINFFMSYGNILPMIITIQIPHILHLEGKLFDFRGCLLFVRRDDFGSSEFTIYEMMKGSSVWSVRYHVDTDDFMTSLPEGWSIRSTVWSIVLGEREDDSFLVINLFGKVVEYNLISKNLRDMYDMGSNQLTDDYHDEFIPPFAMYDMRAKQVDHKVYEFISSYASV